MPKHLLNTTFSCELVCDEMEENPSTAKCLSHEMNNTLGTNTSSALVPIYFGIGIFLPIVLILIFAIWVYCRRIRKKKREAQSDSWNVNWTSLPMPIRQSANSSNFDKFSTESNDFNNAPDTRHPDVSNNEFEEIDLHAPPRIPDRPPQVLQPSGAGYISAFKRQFLLSSALIFHFYHLYEFSALC